MQFTHIFVSIKFYTGLVSYWIPAIYTGLWNLKNQMTTMGAFTGMYIKSNTPMVNNLMVQIKKNRINFKYKIFFKSF